MLPVRMKSPLKPDNSLDLWLGKPAPRYTSYPPAPFFHAGVKAVNYQRSLKSLPPDQPISLYIHIPFCRNLCLYCGCNTMITNRSERIDRYLASLKHEITMVAALIGTRRVSTLHFGGGTPNAMSSPDIRSLFTFLRNTFDFSGIGEIAMELDPRVSSAEQVQTLADCGVTRVSLGVQDFDAEVQSVIHRIQPYELVAELCGWLRSTGINGINFDLMYGLPKQTPKTVTDTARRVCVLKPDRIALFSYAHVPQMKKHQKVLEEHGIPDVYERLELDQLARDILTDHGYQPIGIDHFARADDSMAKTFHDGNLHRGFQGYTENEASALLGFGASSISQTSDGYFQNEHDERIYQSTVAANNLPVRRGFLLSHEDRVRRAIIEQMMCSLSCDIAAICDAMDYPLAKIATAFERLDPFVRAGLVSINGATLRLTTPHRMAVRVICKVFDTYTDHASTLISHTA
jgi:oxygen-independent coproporphyrinogen-3 oxidase